jgi:hypothetical protein
VRPSPPPHPAQYLPLHGRPAGGEALARPPRDGVAPAVPPAPRGERPRAERLGAPPALHDAGDDLAVAEPGQLGGGGPERAGEGPRVAVPQAEGDHRPTFPSTASSTPGLSCPMYWCERTRESPYFLASESMDDSESAGKEWNSSTYRTNSRRSPSGESARDIAARWNWVTRSAPRSPALSAPTLPWRG